MHRRGMPFTPSRRTPLTALATLACGATLLTGCSGSSSSGAGDSSTSVTPTSSSAATSTTPTSSMTSAAGAASSSASATSSSSSAVPSSSSSTSTADPVGACTTANSRINSAITRWNTAVTDKGTAKLDSAARNFRSTATPLRGLTDKADDKGFTTRVRKVATDFDNAATARLNRRSVSTTSLNTDARALTTYCQKLITQ